MSNLTTSTVVDRLMQSTTQQQACDAVTDDPTTVINARVKNLRGTAAQLDASPIKNGEIAIEQDAAGNTTGRIRIGNSNEANGGTILPLPDYFSKPGYSNPNLKGSAFSGGVAEEDGFAVGTGAVATIAGAAFGASAFAGLQSWWIINGSSGLVLSDVNDQATYLTDPSLSFAVGDALSIAVTNNRLVVVAVDTFSVSAVSSTSITLNSVSSALSRLDHLRALKTANSGALLVSKKRNFSGQVAFGIGDTVGMCLQTTRYGFFEYVDIAGNVDLCDDRNEFYITPGHQYDFVVHAMASNASTEDIATFVYAFTIRRTTAGVTELVGSPEAVRAKTNTAGASAWTFTVSADNTNKRPKYTVNSGTTATLSWHLSCDVMESAMMN
jgi:hypothetical protein